MEFLSCRANQDAETCVKVAQAVTNQQVGLIEKFINLGDSSNTRDAIKTAIDACTRAISSSALTGHELAVTLVNRGVLYDRQARDVGVDFEKGLDESHKESMRIGALAVADYDEAIRINPNDAAAYYDRGGAYAARSDHDRLADFDQTIRLTPSSALFYVGRAQQYERRALLESRSLKITPPSLRPNTGLPDPKVDREHAKSDYEAALALSPKTDQDKAAQGTARFELEYMETHKSDYEEPASSAIAQFLGDWKNVDPNTPALMRILITDAGGAILVHAWGSCSPSPCDQGTVKAMPYAPNVSAPLPENAQYLQADHWTSFSVVTLVLGPAPAPGGNLSTHMLTRFTDNSGRSDHVITELFKK